MKPQFKNSRLNVENNLTADKTYFASAWLQHKNGMKTSEEEKQNINQIVQQMLMNDITGISIQIQTKDDQGNFTKVSNVRLFLENPNSTFKRIGDADVPF